MLALEKFDENKMSRLATRDLEISMLNSHGREDDSYVRVLSIPIIMRWQFQSPKQFGSQVSGLGLFHLPLYLTAGVFENQGLIKV
jgi:hypothetical protein